MEAAPRLGKSMLNTDKPFYSLEFFPPKDKDNWPKFLQTAAKLKAMNPLFASVTYGAGGGSQDSTLEIASQLQSECGYVPMPHLTCVGADRSKICAYIERLQEAGINNILALRGDAPAAAGSSYDWSRGEFTCAADLVDFVRERFPDLGIAVAGYPAPHPEARTFAADRNYLAQKLDAGGDFVITQLFFDVREYVDLVERLAEKGIHKPVLPGVFTIQSFESLRHVFSLCGANVSSLLYLQLEEANNKGGVEAVRDVGVEFMAGLIRRLVDAGAPGVHLYTMNKSDLCLRIADRVGKL